MSFPALVAGIPVTPTGEMVIPTQGTVMIGNMPAAVMGDPVSGGTFTGTITNGSATVLIGGRPAARATASSMSLTNNQSGVTAASPAIGGVPTVLIGG